MPEPQIQRVFAGWALREVPAADGSHVRLEEPLLIEQDGFIVYMAEGHALALSDSAGRLLETRSWGGGSDV